MFSSVVAPTAHVATRATTRATTALQRRTFYSIIQANQRGVKLFLGKYHGVVEPGIRLNLPFFHQIHRIDVRDTVHRIRRQSLISTDNVTFYVTASIQSRVIDAKKAFLETDDLVGNIIAICQMELRNILSSREINDILTHREAISEELITRMADIEKKWGVKISRINLDDIAFDDSMTRAMAVKAEADRNAEAKIISARADVEAAREFKKAAEIYSETPVSMKLREFQLWQSVSKNPANTMYIVPSNILDFVSQATATATTPSTPAADELVEWDEDEFYIE